jgi:septum formation protein
MLPTLILASASRYRKDLLARLNLVFEVCSPEVDESERPGESPQETAIRLAEEKARTVARKFPKAVVIGSDQIAEVDGIRLNKPGTHHAAEAQLRSMSGRIVRFHTALAVLCIERNMIEREMVPTVVQMRALQEAEIDRYLNFEQPYDCAGSAKIEGLGISLISSLCSEDPTALVGLPLIRLCEMLRKVGYVIP